jgi:hypothetical protein
MRRGFTQTVSIRVIPEKPHIAAADLQIRLKRTI